MRCTAPRYFCVVFAAVVVPSSFLRISAPHRKFKTGAVVQRTGRPLPPCSLLVVLSCLLVGLSFKLDYFRGTERSDFGIRLCAVTFFPLFFLFSSFLHGRRTCHLLVDWSLGVIVCSNLWNYFFRGVERSDFGILLCAVTLFFLFSSFLLHGQRTCHLLVDLSLGVIVWSDLWNYFVCRNCFPFLFFPWTGFLLFKLSSVATKEWYSLQWCALLLVFAHFLSGDRKSVV